MKDQINDIRLIEKFLEGRMTTEEKKDFENKLLKTKCSTI